MLGLGGGFTCKFAVHVQSFIYNFFGWSTLISYIIHHIYFPFPQCTFILNYPYRLSFANSMPAFLILHVFHMVFGIVQVFVCFFQHNIIKKKKNLFLKLINSILFYKMLHYSWNEVRISFTEIIHVYIICLFF